MVVVWLFVFPPKEFRTTDYRAQIVSLKPPGGILSNYPVFVFLVCLSFLQTWLRKLSCALKMSRLEILLSEFIFHDICSSPGPPSAQEDVKPTVTPPSAVNYDIPISGLVFAK
jgi:hypothetical protein